MWFMFVALVLIGLFGSIALLVGMIVGAFPIWKALAGIVLGIAVAKYAGDLAEDW